MLAVSFSSASASWSGEVAAAKFGTDSRRIEAFGGGILQARDDALGAVGQFAGLGPLRRVFARAVELLDRGALGLRSKKRSDFPPSISRNLSATG